MIFQRYVARNQSYVVKYISQKTCCFSGQACKRPGTPAQRGLDTIRRFCYISCSYNIKPAEERE